VEVIGVEVFTPAGHRKVLRCLPLRGTGRCRGARIYLFQVPFPLRGHIDSIRIIELNLENKSKQFIWGLGSRNLISMSDMTCLDLT
ncbi:MAG TPA: hypothetical protein DD636_07985, partial [Anaerolineaceae bacterium]|nr:hypothetical protein [Anaerolineaceae bacterium]